MLDRILSFLSLAIAAASYPSIWLSDTSGPSILGTLDTSDTASQNSFPALRSNGGMPASKPKTGKKQQSATARREFSAVTPYIGKTLSVPTGYQRSAVVGANVPSQTQTITFSRWSQLTALTTSTTVESVKAYNFKLSDVANPSDISSAFDAYRIKRVDVYFTPRVNFTPDASILTNAQLWSALDFDGNTVSTITEIASYDSSQLHDMRKSFVISLEPRAVLATYAATVFTSYAEAPRGQWIDCNNTGVEHYGLIVGVSAQAAITSINVAARFHIEAKRSR
jgi:hypothetical protein